MRYVVGPQINVAVNLSTAANVRGGRSSSFLSLQTVRNVSLEWLVDNHGKTHDEYSLGSFQTAVRDTHGAKTMDSNYFKKNSL